MPTKLHIISCISFDHSMNSSRQSFEKSKTSSLRISEDTRITPLLCAIHSKNAGMVDFLIKNKADTSILFDDKKLIDAAREYGSHEIVKLIVDSWRWRL